MNEFYIRQTLMKLGVKRRYYGYRFLVKAAALALEDESRLLHIKEQVYQPVADFYDCKAANVARNIRTVSVRVWEDSPDALRQISGVSCSAPPSASELIEIVTTYVLRTWPQALETAEFTASKDSGAGGDSCERHTGGSCDGAEQR